LDGCQQASHRFIRADADLASKAAVVEVKKNCNWKRLHAIVKPQRFLLDRQAEDTNTLLLIVKIGSLFLLELIYGRGRLMDIRRSCGA
jgi:hypothetical protein